MTTDTTKEKDLQRRTLNLPEHLCAAAELRFGRHFPDLESLLEFVLRELTGDQAESLDQAEQALLDQRLKDLGYI